MRTSHNLKQRQVDIARTLGPKFLMLQWQGFI